MEGFEDPVSSALNRSSLSNRTSLEWLVGGNNVNNVNVSDDVRRMDSMGCNSESFNTDNEDTVLELPLSMPLWNGDVDEEGEGDLVQSVSSTSTTEANSNADTTTTSTSPPPPSHLERIVDDNDMSLTFANSYFRNPHRHRRKRPTLAPPPEPTSPAALLQYQTNPPFYLAAKQPLECPSCDNQDWFRGDREAFLRNEIPVYTLAIPRPRLGVIDVTYFRFHAYNKGKDVCVGLYKTSHHSPTPRCIGGRHRTLGNHLGDWESTTVRLDWKTLDPTGYYYAAHHFGNAYNIDEIEVVEGTKHHVVYSALDSHGAWYRPGNHTYMTLPNREKLIDITVANNGYEWDTWKNIELVVWDGKTLFDNEWSWMNFRGRWGNRREECYLWSWVNELCVLADGPTSPVQKKYVVNAPVYS